MAEFDEQAISTTMWAVAKVAYHDPQLVDASVAAVMTRAPAFHKQGLANLS
eukprot:CAMPEP_0181513936 /NCGR_PEP_ID=MMETSP1110-20121109/62763_1 /TAXON_ID=174948 /ORGANISM="Symbiodinium sp., Strain CCMP421" /LENGTH=50 /DNA_ID=CAMNT_0023643833 /DNA_START=134 /DNA_END=283 /DNA_ORIENTATION=+